MAAASQQEEISEEFMINCRNFFQDYDQLAAENLFAGHKLEVLCRNFIQSIKGDIECCKFIVENCKFPNCNYEQTLDEDLKILKSPIKVVNIKEEQLNCEIVSSQATTTNRKSKFLAEVYWRAAQACYTRLTFNKSRRLQDDDRGEAVEMARFSLRFNPDNFKTCYWYMITLGWQLDVMSNPREKTLVSKIFKLAAERCIKMEPQDPLAHNLLGRYYYNVASLSWFEKTVAGKFLGAKLDGSYEDAEREFRLAHELGKANWLPNFLWMARVLMAQRRPRDEISEWVEYGLRLDCREPSSELERLELEELHQKLVND